jgi:hypothetical protein
MSDRRQRHHHLTPSVLSFCFALQLYRRFLSRYHDCIMSASILSTAIRGNSSYGSSLARRTATIPRPAPWTCRTCLQQRHTFASTARRLESNATRPSSSNKRRRRLLVLGGGIALGAAVVTLSDDAGHAFSAAQRTYRVAATLALNIKE